MNRDVDIARRKLPPMDPGDEVHHWMLTLILQCLLAGLAITIMIVGYSTFTFMQRERAYYACLEVHKLHHSTQNIYLSCNLR